MRRAAEVIARPRPAADQAQQQTLHKELPQQPRASGAHRRAHSDFAPASLRSRQEQPSDIDRRQQPDRQHQAIQRQQPRAYTAGEEARVVLYDDAVVQLLAWIISRFCCLMPASSRVASSTVFPVRSRPSTFNMPEERSCRFLSVASSGDSSISLPPWKRKLSGITPITVYGVPFSVIARPTALGSRLNSVCQASAPRMTTCARRPVVFIRGKAASEGRLHTQHGEKIRAGQLLRRGVRQCDAAHDRHVECVIAH